MATIMDQDTITSTPKRGGRREGAGRPRGSTTSEPDRTIAFRMPVAEIEASIQPHAEPGESVNQAARRLLREYLANL